MKKLILVTTVLIFSLSAFSSARNSSTFNAARKNAVTNYKTRSINQLKLLLKRGYKPSEVQLTLARVYYDKGKLNKALEHYKKVSKGSEYWLEAVEEIAWTYMRKGDYSKSYAQTMTLLAPIFDQFVNPQAYYLSAINRYFVCDYKGVFKTTKQFKDRYKRRIVSLESLVEKKSHSSIDAVIGLAKVSPVKFTQAARYTVELPYYFYRDKLISKYLRQVGSEFGQSKAYSPSSSPISGRLKSKINRRFVQLAKRDLKIIKKNIEKLHLVEAEVIQRVYEQNNLPQAPKQKLSKTNGKDFLSFPVSDDEIWLDELNSFEARTSKCPTRSQKEASL